MRRDQRRRGKTTGGSFKPGEFILRIRAMLALSLKHFLKNGVQRIDRFFGNDRSIRTWSLRLEGRPLGVTGRHEERHTFALYGHAETGLPVFSPSRQSRSRGSVAKAFGRRRWIEPSLSVGIDKGIEQRGHSSAAGSQKCREAVFHPETQRHSEKDFKGDFGKPDRGFQVHPCDQADGFYE